MIIGVCGCGYWGKNYLRIFSELIGQQNVYAYDQDRNMLSAVAEKFLNINVCSRLEDLLDEAQGVVIATSPSSHHELSLRALMSGRDILVEKPMAMSSSQCAEIINLAEHNHCEVLVGHTFLYNSAIIEAKNLLSAWEFRRIYYLESFRRHLGLIREDVDALWDLAAHDIAIFNYWLGCSPMSVQAIGWHFLSEGRADTTSLFLNYPGGIKGVIHVSWIDASKRRDISVVSGDAKLMFDDLNPEFITVEHKGAILGGYADSFGEFKAQVRSGTSYKVRVPLSEPLKNICQHFIACVERKDKPRTPGIDGQRVVSVLEAATRSLNREGALTGVING